MDWLIWIQTSLGVFTLYKWFGFKLDWVHTASVSSLNRVSVMICVVIKFAVWTEIRVEFHYACSYWMHMLNGHKFCRLSCLFHFILEIRATPQRQCTCGMYCHIRCNKCPSCGVTFPASQRKMALGPPRKYPTNLFTQLHKKVNLPWPTGHYLPQIINCIHCNMVFKFQRFGVVQFKAWIKHMWNMSIGKGRKPYRRPRNLEGQIEV